MPHLNIEFKAKAKSLQQQEAKLKSLNPRFIGEDLQCDTYSLLSEKKI